MFDWLRRRLAWRAYMRGMARRSPMAALPAPAVMLDPERLLDPPSPVAAATATAVAGYRARPLMVNPVGMAAIELDWYRLDAITRHCEQLVEAGGDAGHRLIWKAEHFVEATERFVSLNKLLRAMPDSEAKLLCQAKLRELRDRLRAIGWNPAEHLGDDA